MKRIGIVVALSAEAACLLDPPPRPGDPVTLDDRFLLVVSGMGTARAREAAMKLLDAGAGALINMGFAGALDNRLAAGDVLIPREVINGTERIATDAAWGEAVRERIGTTSLALREGTIACSPVPLHTPADKEALRRLTSAAGVDMESAAIARLAVERRVPSLIVRSVLDVSNASLPPAVLECSDIYGRADTARLRRLVLRRPSLLLPLAGLAFALRGAARSLRRISAERVRLLAVA